MPAGEVSGTGACRRAWWSARTLGVQEETTRSITVRGAVPTAVDRIGRTVAAVHAIGITWRSRREAFSDSADSGNAEHAPSQRPAVRPPDLLRTDGPAGYRGEVDCN